MIPSLLLAEDVHTSDVVIFGSSQGPFFVEFALPWFNCFSGFPRKPVTVFAGEVLSAGNLTIVALVRTRVRLTCYVPIRPFLYPRKVCSPPGDRDDRVSEFALTRNREFTLEEKYSSTMGLK